MAGLDGKRGDDLRPAGPALRSPRRIRSGSCLPPRRRSASGPARSRGAASPRKPRSGSWRRCPCRAGAAGRMQSLRARPARRSCKRLRQLVAQLVRGEIELQRRHRDEIALHGVKVGAFAQLRRVAAEAQPVIRQAAPVGPLLDAEIVGELALAGDARALDLFRPAAREVQVEERADRQVDGEQRS